METPLFSTLLPLIGAVALAAPTALGPDGYAVVVGSNRPGPGQQALRYAHADADRMRSVLTELGQLPADRVVQLTDPSADQLLRALDVARDELEAHPDATLLFYYSGHARADGLDLGPDRLSLDLLRERLEALPAKVRLVVLDACQSGAVSGVKGVAPAANFSAASIAGLHAEGTAILASSTANELSQESERLGGGIFTHHLVTGLRGAADRDQDQVVTLEEAYAYAHDHTLVQTASTAVGRQHATLETNLRGRGALALTRTAESSARLSFAAGDTGEILIRSERGAVVAEVSKVVGDALELALPSGTYRVIWRQGDHTRACSQELTEGTASPFAPVRCARVPDEAVAARGTVGSGGPKRLEKVLVEAGVGLLQRPAAGAYVDTLEDFGFGELWVFDPPTPEISVGWTAQRYIALVGTWSTLSTQRWQRKKGNSFEDLPPTTFSWRSQRATVEVRAQLPLLRGWLVPYAQVGGGIGISRSEFVDVEWTTGPAQRQAAPALVGGGGLQVMPVLGPDQWRYVGLFVGVERVYSPALRNLFGDTHDVGGTRITTGLRIAQRGGN